MMSASHVDLQGSTSGLLLLHLTKIRNTMKLYCACINPSLASHTHPPPEYVGDHYFCDTGSRDGVIHGSTYTSDPLWDGAGCEGENECCSFNSPPWFYRDLLECNSDDLEVRVCRDESRGNEDIGVQVIEIYVQ